MKATISAPSWERPLPVVRPAKRIESKDYASVRPSNKERKFSVLFQLFLDCSVQSIMSVGN